MKIRIFDNNGRNNRHYPYLVGFWGDKGKRFKSFLVASRWANRTARMMGVDFGGYLPSAIATKN